MTYIPPQVRGLFKYLDGVSGQWMVCTRTEGREMLLHTPAELYMKCEYLPPYDQLPLRDFKDAYRP